MKVQRKANSLTAGRTLDVRLAGYLTAAGAVTAAMATDAKAIVVGNNTVQPFGINGAVNIDFNKDGQTDFQIDHDRDSRCQAAGRPSTICNWIRTTSTANRIHSPSIQVQAAASRRRHFLTGPRHAIMPTMRPTSLTGRKAPTRPH